MKPFIVDGITMDKEYMIELRQSMIELRDASIKANMLDWAFNISLVIAVLAHVIEALEP